MVERRMFHTAVVESDAFLDLPPGAQALYFHLGMHADDDGEQGERRRWRKQRPARVAGVGGRRSRAVGKENTGHPNRMTLERSTIWLKEECFTRR